MKLRFVCQDVILNGEKYPPGPPWYMHVSGSCSPTDCDWGEVGADYQRIGDRWMIRAFYDHGFARRWLYADMSLYQAGRLWVWMYTDFDDPDRGDYASQAWFDKV